MIGRPERDEAAEYYFTYIDRLAGDDPIGILERQREELLPFLSAISEEKSLHRYAPGKWSIRETLNHVNDVERLSAFRALWFARGLETPLPSFDQDAAVPAARADDVAWAALVGEFLGVRQATISLFRNLPPQAWMKAGIASDNRFTVRALAFMIAGHAAHHAALLRERYLQ